MKRTGLAHILCAVDFSQFSSLVTAWGILFARRFDARLTVMHTVYSPGDPIYASAEFERGGEQGRRLAEAREKLATLMQGCPVGWEPLVVPGDPVIKAADEARRLKVDLVIAASHGVSAFKRLFIGTVVERMARRVACPLLVLRSLPPEAGSDRIARPPLVERIMAACDLLESSDSAVGLAAFLARAFDAELHLAHVMESAINEALVDSTAGHYADVQQTLAEKTDIRLRECIPRDVAEELRIRTLLEQGAPGDRLLVAAGKTAPDMLVIGVRYHHALGKLLIGSTTEKMLRRAPCPVLAVPGAVVEKTGKAFSETLKTTGIVRDPVYMDHETAPGHPEQPGRLAAVYDVLDDGRLGDHLVVVPPRRAEAEEILAVHSREYLQQVAASRHHARAALAPDTPVSRGSYRAALYAAGGLLALIERVVAGELKNGFALVRPPGHHAERNRAMGYCLFNNVAVGAAYARNLSGIERILIVDWDVHHGNGTQHIFEIDPTVLFFSIHQYPHFPGSGFFTEVGMGAGEGYTVNIPLAGGYGSGDYAELFDRVLRPLAYEFKPDLILVSAGFDVHSSDPLGGMRVDSEGIAVMTRILMEIAEETCRGRLVFTLEGGYDLEAMAGGVKAVLRELTGLSVTNIANFRKETVKQKRIATAIQHLKQVHGNFWQCMQ